MILPFRTVKIRCELLIVCILLVLAPFLHFHGSNKALLAQEDSNLNTGNSKNTTVQKVTVRGTVLALKTRQPLAGVAVRVQNTSLGAYSRGDGSFIVGKVPANSISLLASMIGYSSVELPLTSSTVQKRNDTL
jgi:hypothetical protein